MENLVPLLFALSPLAVVGVGALFLMLAEALFRNRGGLAFGAFLILATGAVFSVAAWMQGPSFEGADALKPWLVFDRFGFFLNALVCLGGALAALLSGAYLPEHRMERGEFYSILVFSTMGGMILVSAGDFLTLFLGLETLSLGAYAMTAFRRSSPRAAEGALKYFLLGSFAAAILLYGFALLYGATGHTDLVSVGSAIRGNPSARVLIAMVLVLAGLAFKVSAVPFHAWTPDAYEGAPTPASAYMAVVVKAAAFGVMLRVLLTVFGSEGAMSWASGWPPVVAWLAAITMTVANLVAGQQSSVKRMLAYSSIAHAGYLLVGVVATMRMGQEAVASVLFYLFGYALSTAGAFGTLILCGSHGKETVSYEDLSGIGRRHPAAALSFALFLVSLAGIPPTLGFFGKWMVVKAAVDGGFTLLAVTLLVNSVLGAYYYLRVLVAMYMREPAAGSPIAVPMRSMYANAALLVSALLVIFFGLFPGKMVSAAKASSSVGAFTEEAH